jgi:hypothetical protein
MKCKDCIHWKIEVDESVNLYEEFCKYETDERENLVNQLGENCVLFDAGKCSCCGKSLKQFIVFEGMYGNYRLCSDKCKDCIELRERKAWAYENLNKY